MSAIRVSIFITCLADHFYPRVGEAMARVLHSLGAEVDFQQAQTCCGQPAFNSGYATEARQAATTLINAFEHSDYVVSPSGSCTGMVHHYYPDLFADDPRMQEKARQLIGKTYEFTQFLVQVMGVTDVDAVFPHKVTYHPSCHASRLLGVKEEPLMLLEGVKDIELVDLPYANDCCGFGGTFAVKMHEISEAMVSEKTEHVLETGAEVLVGTDMGCLMNIGGRLRHQGKSVRVMHVAELLHEGMKGGHRG